MDVSDEEVGSERSVSSRADEGDGKSEESEGDVRGNGENGAKRGGRDGGADSDGEGEWLLFARDVASSVGAVLLVGVFLFAVSGVWPPLVAVESPSMHPNMQTGDLVLVVDHDRFPGDGARGDTGVVPADRGAATDYVQFQQPGDVIVFQPDGSESRTPVIHRAMFWVEDGENWYARADSETIRGAEDCEEMRNCPAPHAGFVTKGDNNAAYDQVTGLSEPVRPQWVVGSAEARVPRVGCLRLPNEPCLPASTAVAG